MERLLNGRSRRKIAGNTYLESDRRSLRLRLHKTDILFLRTDDVLVVNNGGWFTNVTMDRLNSFLPVPLYTERGLWYWQTGEPFTNGDMIAADGTLLPQRKEVDRIDRVTERTIKSYAAKCVDAADPEVLREASTDELDRSPEYVRQLLQTQTVDMRIVALALKAARPTALDYYLQHCRDMLTKNVTKVIRRLYLGTLSPV